MTTATRRKKKLTINPYFTKSFKKVEDIYNDVDWVNYRFTIGDQSIQCEFPKDMDIDAARIVATRYFFSNRKLAENPIVEKSFKDLISRVADTITYWGLKSNYFDRRNAKIFQKELTYILLHRYAAFNSPVWFNVGVYHKYKIEGSSSNWIYSSKKNRAIPITTGYVYPQTSACYIVSVEDNLDSIMDLAKIEAKIFKYGSGSGTNLSTIRSSYEYLDSNDGKPSGPCCFMRIYDQTAHVVRSGGKTRRAAKMQILNIDHPDIEQFIKLKSIEEDKARLLKENGISNYYDEVFFQNANLSIRVTDAFMQAVLEDKEWNTYWVTEKRKANTYKARDLLWLAAECAWKCGDPGIQFHDTCNKYNTTPYPNRPINGSNPCSEVHLPDDTACNLASINLIKFLKDDGTFDVEKLMQVIRIIFIAQEILIDNSSYPTKKIAENSHNLRPIGLGFTNFGGLLLSQAISYASKEGRLVCSAICAFLTAICLKTSVELAEIMGPFPAFYDKGKNGETNADAYYQVIQYYVNDCKKLLEEFEETNHSLILSAKNLLELAYVTLQSYEKGIPIRNSQLTSIAPTGTISFIMGADTTGIEPELAIVKYKHLAISNQTIQLVNRLVPKALAKLGYTKEQIDDIWKYIEKKNTIIDAPHVKKEHYPIFRCAYGPNALSPMDHLLMVAAAQKFITQGISKTINMPNNCTVEDIYNIYIEAWKLGLKCVSVYRDGSKAHQVLTTEEKKSTAVATIKDKVRNKLPTTRVSRTHKFSINGHDGYIIVGFYEDSKPGEIFLIISKEGSTIRGLSDCFATAVSIGLQYGVPIEAYIEKFKFVRFEPAGITQNREIPFAHSFVDYVFRWIENEIIKKDKPGDEKQEVQNPIEEKKNNNHEEWLIFCDKCSSPMQRTGTCFACPGCGETTGCS
ncbi:MAG: vitamin B12-dependent ribonucleotide reductase [Nitrososphaerota archaeon]